MKIMMEMDLEIAMVPIRNLYSRDSGDAGETFSSPLTDNSAWLR